MKVFLLALVLLAIAIGGIAIKMFLVPGGSFTKKCGSSLDPKTGKPMPCTCSSDNSETCDNSPDEKNTSELILRLGDKNSI